MWSNRGMPLALAGIAALAAGLVFGLIGRTLLRSRVRLAWSTAVLVGIVGAILGGTLASVFQNTSTAARVLISVGLSIGFTVVLMLAVDQFQRRRQVPRGSIHELIAAGESARVEFKSSARFNYHSKARDERVEQVIVKTVAGFLNAEGGCLLIGVSDDGAVLGLAEDYQLMKMPDRDRYELFLRDVLTKAMGAAATTTVTVEFSSIGHQEVCLLRIPPSSRPIFVVLGKEGAKQFIVRVGNSTRSLEVDEALAYCSRRWGARGMRGIGR